MAENPLRAVLIGCGGVTTGAWLPAIIKNPAIELVALVDLNPDQARRCAEQFGLVNVPLETDLERALTATSPEAVFDCTIPAAHHDVVMTALRHGCHVLGEKPLSDNLEHARAMVAAARQSGRTYAVIQNRRYFAGVRRLRAFLDSGVLGRITTLYGEFFIGAHVGGFRAQMDHAFLLDMAIHHFDLARFLLAHTTARSVFCHEWNPPGSWFRHGAAAEAIFELDRGVVFQYRGSFCAEGIRTSWQGSWRIVGEKGSVLWDGEDGFEAEIVEEEKGFERTFRKVEVPAGEFAAQSEGHASVINAFVDAVRAGTVPETVCTDNIHSLKMVFGSIESAERGASVEISAD